MLGRNIGFKLTFGVVLTVLVTIGIFAWFNIQSQSRSLLSEVERHASQLSEAVKSDTEYDMLRNDRERIHESIRRIGQQDSIDRIRVFNKTGEIIYSSEETDIGRMVDTQTESCYRCHSAGEPLEHLEMQERTRIFTPGPDSPRLLGIINPIYNAPSCWTADCHAHPETQTVLGVLDVTIPLTEVDRNIRHSQIAAIILAFSVILILSLIVGLMVRWWIDRPVQELLAATRSVAGGNLAYRLTVKRDDELGMLANSFNNMTDKLAQARLQLFQSDKLASLGRLAAGVAHEINNPLTAVLTYSSYLLKRSQGRPETHKDLQVIVSETIRCREIVKNLLDFARQTVPKKRKADINEIVGRAAKVIENQLALGRVQLVMDLDPALPSVTVDANQIQQVFINLMVNAADAIGDDEGHHQGHEPGDQPAARRGSADQDRGVPQAARTGRPQVPDRRQPRHHHALPQAGAKRAHPPRSHVRIERAPVERHAPARGRRGTAVPGVLDLADCRRRALPEVRRSDLCLRSAVERPRAGLPAGGLRLAQLGAGRCQLERRVRGGPCEDDGCGIPKSQIPHLFEPFATTKGPKGTGLGLAVSWGIIDNHNGKISVESEVGVGTTFVVRIPVQA
jgi:two-component system, NtrC family, sensor kinase